MTRSRLDDDLRAPLDPGQQGQSVQADPPPGPHPATFPTRLPPSWIATSAIALAGALATVSLAAVLGGAMDWLSSRQVMVPLTIALAGTFLTATLAAIGWMHASRRRDGGVDSVGMRRSLMAGVIAGVTLVGVTWTIGQPIGHHEVETELSVDTGAR